ncbi:MAG: DegV family protein, partial [Lachnospira sp.]|nr:DegV family protein [Lachnospira sp.]
IKIIPFSYFIGDEEFTCLDTESFDGVDYYNRMLNGVRVTTSQINPQRYIDHFEPILKDGSDILFIGMSSGISGSYESAGIAANQLLEDYPDRKIILIDSLGASLGEGLLAVWAYELKEQGKSIEETAEKVSKIRDNMYQVFTVDDLKYLQRGGRISNATAIAGTVLNIKPLLKGNEHGKIVSFAKFRGRKRAIEALAKKYEELAIDQSDLIVGISHANCADDANTLKELLMKIQPPKEVVIVQHEPVTGSYLGPGALALFFQGKDGARLM